MKQRPILFKSEMVQAILAGRKTQTRRIVKPSIVPHLEWMGGSGDDSTEFDSLGLMYNTWRNDNGKEMPAEWLVYCDEYPEEGVIPIGQGYGAVGDQLWVRETFTQGYDMTLLKGEGDDMNAVSIIYKADGKELYRECPEEIAENWGDWSCDGEGDPVFKPSIHMPRWASRILLEITDIRVERLNDISEADAKAEGAIAEPCDHARQSCEDIGCCGSTAKGHFKQIWESINGVDSWAANPWVWVIEFKVVQGGDL